MRLDPKSLTLTGLLAVTASLGCAAAPFEVNTSVDRFTGAEVMTSSRGILLWERDVLAVRRSIRLYPVWELGRSVSFLVAQYSYSADGRSSDDFRDSRTRIEILVDGSTRVPTVAEPSLWEASLTNRTQRIGSAIDESWHQTLADATTIEIRIGGSEYVLSPEATGEMKAFYRSVLSGRDALR